MSLVEAAAALDRLLQGQGEGGATPSNVPPYAPPPATSDDGNLLPMLFPNATSSRGRQCSTPTGRSFPPMILPWENLEEEPRTPFYRAFSPLPSPIPIPSPILPTLPPPHTQYPPHWMVAQDATWPFEENSPEPQVEVLEVLSQSAKTADDFPKRSKSRRRRKGNHRAFSESAAGCASLDEDFVPLDPEKYKTELCRSFQVHGNCRYGARCNYAHGLQELRGASRHGKYKTRNCQSYHQTGYCRYGARCSFIHDPEEGILKCSIANKEVLAALHYHPSSEEFPHTANITWRFLETSGNTIPEIHLISSTPTKACQSVQNPSDTVEKILYSPNPLQGQINFLISSDDVYDDNRFFTCTLPVCNEVTALNSAILLEENLSLLRSLQSGEQLNNNPDSSFTSKTEAKSFLSPLSATVVVNQIKPRNSSECSQRFPLESSDISPLSLSPIEKVVIKEISSESEAPDEISATPSDYPANVNYQEIKDLEVVQTILREAPLYSATVWSDGADKWHTNSENVDAGAHSEQTGKAKLDILQNKNSFYSKVKEYNAGKRKMKNLFRRRRKTGRRFESEDNENMGIIDTSQEQAQNDNVFSGESGNDSDELEVSTGAAGGDGNDWSEKSSLHLADLLRSLRLREGSNHLLPWSKPGRRCSSDGSSAGPLSVKDARSSPSSPASPRQHDMTKYKTELCRSFQYNGYCSYGDACLYAHGQNDLRSYPKHPMYRTKQCFSFHNKGFCLYGSRCQFLHDLE
ncbi:uncharacterized protein [Macrobrachium rosenbergii]|uniref:uncharacterized protein isoform X1 n=1 Tax=Macrobrachium rosenbergii TaxID=79674 RepID=UPI0034D49081